MLLTDQGVFCKPRSASVRLIGGARMGMKRPIPREMLDDRLGLGISGSRKLQRLAPQSKSCWPSLRPAPSRA
jgi:hypothetical protein